MGKHGRDAVAFHIEAYADTARSGAVALTLPSAFWPNQDIRTVGAPFKIAAADGTVTYESGISPDVVLVAEALYDPFGRG